MRGENLSGVIECHMMPDFVKFERGYLSQDNYYRKMQL